VDQPRRLPRLGSSRDQSREPPPEPTSLGHHSPPLRNSRQRRFGSVPSSCSVAPIEPSVSGPAPFELGGVNALGSGPELSSITTTRRSGNRPGTVPARGLRTFGAVGRRRSLGPTGGCPGGRLRIAHRFRGHVGCSLLHCRPRFWGEFW